MLESYDKELAEGRDKKIYRDKGTRDTSIKTVYGEVSYSRPYADKIRMHMPLLDAMQSASTKAFMRAFNS